MTPKQFSLHNTLDPNVQVRPPQPEQLLKFTLWVSVSHGQKFGLSDLATTTPLAVPQLPLQKGAVPCQTYSHSSQPPMGKIFSEGKQVGVSIGPVGLGLGPCGGEKE